jgi:hypothetical protein
MSLRRDILQPIRVPLVTGLKGIVVSGAENLLRWSEDFSQSEWATNATMTPSADELVASDVLNAEVRQVVTRPTNGETATFSVELKTNNGSAEWDLLIAEYNGNTLLNSTSQDIIGLTGSYQRFEVSHTGVEATGDRWRVRIRRTNAAGAADGDALGAQKAQLEVGASFTSYSKTE